MTAPPVPSSPQINVPNVFTGVPDGTTQVVMAVATVAFYLALNLVWGLVDDLRHRGELR